jgi:hypothetical protein
MTPTFHSMVDMLVALTGQKQQGNIDWKALPYYETVFPYPPDKTEAGMFDSAFLRAVTNVGGIHGGYDVKRQDGSTVRVAVVGADAADVKDRVKRFCLDRGWTGFPT